MQVVEGHPDRPIPAAVFEPAQTSNEDGLVSLVGRAGLDELLNGGPLGFDLGDKAFATTPPAQEGESASGDEEFGCGKSGTGSV